jgi:hypothetical protein
MNDALYTELEQQREEIADLTADLKQLCDLILDKTVYRHKLRYYALHLVKTRSL